MKHKLFIAVGCVAAALLLLVIIEVLIILRNGTPVPVPNIPRGPETYGSGPPLRYVIIGDSTGVAQGADYDKGIARGTARFLEQNNTITMYNFSISGARTGDALTKQIPEAVKIAPDVALIDLGANDVTHLTPIKNIVQNIQKSVAALQASNPSVRIVVTGAPQMGSVPRFPQPIRYAAKLRTNSVNAALSRADLGEHVVLAPLAAQTGPVFGEHPELFAADKFHPTAAGYQVWIPVLNTALQTALQIK